MLFHVICFLMQVATYHTHGVEQGYSGSATYCTVNLKRLKLVLPNSFHMIWMHPGYDFGSERLEVKIIWLESEWGVKCSSGCWLIDRLLVTVVVFEASKRPTRDDLALIMYTSGSTGLPKGMFSWHYIML